MQELLKKKDSVNMQPLLGCPLLLAQASAARMGGVSRNWLLFQDLAEDN